MSVERENDKRTQEAYGENRMCKWTFYYISDSKIKCINYKRNICYGVCYARNNLGYSRVYLQ